MHLAIRHSSIYQLLLPAMLWGAIVIKDLPSVILVALSRDELE